MCGGGGVKQTLGLSTPAPPPAPPPAPVAAPVATAAQPEASLSDPKPESAVGKLGKLKARGGLLIDKTVAITGAANSTTGGLNIPN